MSRLFRVLGFAVCSIQLIFGLAFAFQWQPITQLWPFSNTYITTIQAAAAPADYSYVVIGSIFVAAAASTFWALISRENVAFAGIAVDYILIFAAVSIYAFQIASGDRNIQGFGVIGILSVIIGLVLFMWGSRQPVHDHQHTPALIRVIFAIFVIALLLAGGSLVLKVPNILPWAVTPAAGVLYGWMFLGAGGYFAYGVLRPVWRANAVGQLVGFLAYDLVLIVPFLRYLSAVPDRWRTNLIIYLIVIIGSGVLAIYTLFVHPATRLAAFGRRLPR